MRIFVVTGGAGFIGSNIVQRLVERGDRVRVIDNLVSGHQANLDSVRDDIDFINADINDTLSLGAALAGADCVFHQAALSSVQLGVEQPLRVNQACVNGTLNVLDQARRAGVRRVVFSSSSAVYGDRPCSANRETDIPMPISPYAAAMLCCENYCRAFSHSYGIETVSLRYFNVFGPHQDPHTQYAAVIPQFISRILDFKQPIVFGDGTQSRDFVYVDDVVDANLLAGDAEGISGRTFNIATGKPTNLLELILQLSDALGIPLTPEFQDPRIGDIRTSLADITAAQKELGFSPKTDFKTGILKTVDYYKSLVLHGMT